MPGAHPFPLGTALTLGSGRPGQPGIAPSHMAHPNIQYGALQAGEEHIRVAVGISFRNAVHRFGEAGARGIEGVGLRRTVAV